jgi:hypothetical protein
LHCPPLDERYPPFYADVGSILIKALAVRIWAFCASNKPAELTVSERPGRPEHSRSIDAYGAGRWAVSFMVSTVAPSHRSGLKDTVEGVLVLAGVKLPPASTGLPDPALCAPASWGWIPGFYFKMLTARAITSTPMTRDTTASVIIISLAHRLIAETSVGLNAVAVQNDSDR